MYATSPIIADAWSMAVSTHQFYLCYTLGVLDLHKKYTSYKTVITELL